MGIIPIVEQTQSQNKKTKHLREQHHSLTVLIHKNFTYTINKMALTRKDLMNELYDAGLITLGAVGVSMISKKLTRDNLGVPSTPQGMMKLAVAIGGGSLFVQYLQNKKLVPDDPFKPS